MRAAVVNEDYIIHVGNEQIQTLNYTGLEAPLLDMENNKYISKLHLGYGDKNRILKKEDAVYVTIDRKVLENIKEKYYHYFEIGNNSVNIMYKED